MSAQDSKLQFAVGKRTWAEARDQLPDALQSLPPQCESLRQLLQQMMTVRSKPAEIVYQASGLLLGQAKAMLDIEFDDDSPKYIWDIQDNLAVDSEKIETSWAISAVNQIKKSRYYRHYGDESLIRSVIDVLLCGRLEELTDDSANHRLQVAAEVDVSVNIRNLKGLESSNSDAPAVIRGRADWMLGYGLTKKCLDSMLVIIEAKRYGASASAIPQLMCYLVGVQDARQKAGKENSHVFGLMSDSREFRFALLNERRQMFLSDPLVWKSHAPKVVAFLDHILQKAIESSPHTTPVKKDNRQLLNYNRHLSSSFRFGDGEDLLVTNRHTELGLNVGPAVDIDDESVILVNIDILESEN